MRKRDGEAMLAQKLAELQRQLDAEDGRVCDTEALAFDAVIPPADHAEALPRPQAASAGRDAKLLTGLAEQGNALWRIGMIQHWDMRSSPAEAALAFLQIYTASLSQEIPSTKRKSSWELAELDAYLLEAVSVYPLPKGLYASLAKELGMTTDALRMRVHRIRKRKAIEVRGAYRKGSE